MPMRSFALAITLALLPSAAFADAYAPRCEPLAEIKAGLKDAKFTPLTIGQFHFAQGMYVTSQITPSGGFPPGTGGILIEAKDKFVGIIWTKGKEGCITPIIVNPQTHEARYMPMPLTPDLLALLRAIHTGKLEEPPISPSDAQDSDERKL